MGQNVEAIVQRLSVGNNGQYNIEIWQKRGPRTWRQKLWIIYSGTQLV